MSVFFFLKQNMGIVNLYRDIAAHPLEERVVTCLIRLHVKVSAATCTQDVLRMQTNGHMNGFVWVNFL